MVQDLKHVNCKLSCFRLCFTIFVFCAQHFGPLYRLAFSWAKSPAAKSGSTKLWRLYLWLARASEGSWYCFRSFMFPMHRRQTFQGLLQGCLCGSVWPILTLEFATDTSDRDSIISYLRSQVFNLQNMSLFYYSIVQKRRWCCPEDNANSWELVAGRMVECWSSVQKRNMITAPLHCMPTPAQTVWHYKPMTLIWFVKVLFPPDNHNLAEQCLFVSIVKMT